MRLGLLLLAVLGLLLLTGCPEDDEVFSVETEGETTTFEFNEEEAEEALDAAGQELAETGREIEESVEAEMHDDSDVDETHEQPDTAYNTRADESLESTNLQTGMDNVEIARGELNVDNQTREGFSDLVDSMENHLAALNDGLFAPELEDSLAANARTSAYVTELKREMENLDPTYTVEIFELEDVTQDSAQVRVVMLVEADDAPAERRNLNYTFRLADDGTWQVTNIQPVGTI